MEHRPAKKTLSTARAVRILSAEQADQRHLVEFRGVVTHANPHLGDFFMHDGTSPIYVHPQAEKKLTQGDLVHLTGFTSAGSFAPCVRAVKVTRVGTGTLLDPLPYDLNMDDSRWLDAQYLQCWVIIRKVIAKSGFTLMLVDARNGSATVLIPGEQHAPHFERLLNASVRICPGSTDRHRHWLRYDGSHAGTPLRALFHDQGSRQRNRFGIGLRLRNCSKSER
jgi:hypothetical protein